VREQHPTSIPCRGGKDSQEGHQKPTEGRGPQVNSNTLAFWSGRFMAMDSHAFFHLVYRIM
jgi:hypothetical protein